MNYLLIALTALGFSVLSCLAALRLFPKWGLLDRPEKYQLKRKPIPYPGGFLLYVNFVILTFVFLAPDAKLLSLLFGGGLLVLISFIDDRKGLHPVFRLFMQFLVAVILIVGGIGIEGITNPFGGYFDFTGMDFTLTLGGFETTIMLASALFTIVWIMLIVNTMNWFDGIPGLTSGITAIASLVLFFLSLSVGQPNVAIMALIVSMISFAFWLFDFHPPKMLMGDSGSMFLGLMIAVLAIFSDGKIATTFLILGFPILDLIYVVIYRLYHRRAPWKGGEWDKNRKAVHLHHRMLEFGLSERWVLVIIYLLSASFGIVALFLGAWEKFWAIVFLIWISIVVGMMLRLKRKRGE